MKFFEINLILICSLLQVAIINTTEAQYRGQIKFTPETLTNDNFNSLNSHSDLTPRNNKPRSAPNFDESIVLPRVTSKFRSGNKNEKPVEDLAKKPFSQNRNRKIENNQRASRRHDTDVVETATQRSRQRQTNSRHSDLIQDQPAAVLYQSRAKDKPIAVSNEEKNRRRNRFTSSTEASKEISSVENRRGRSRPNLRSTQSPRQPNGSQPEEPRNVATTPKVSWRGSSKRRGLGPFSSKTNNDAPIDQLEDENYPEHFKLILKSKAKPKILKHIEETSTKTNQILDESLSKTIPIKSYRASFKSKDRIELLPRDLNRTYLSTTEKNTRTTEKNDKKFKFKPRTNDRLQFPSLKNRVVNTSAENLAPENENYNEKQNEENRFSARFSTESGVVKGRSLRQSSGDTNKFKPQYKSVSQRFSSRYRGINTKMLSKQEKDKPLYTPTVPPMTTESYPQKYTLALDVNNDRDAINHIAAAVNDMNTAEGFWNMVDPVADGLMRSEISIDSGDNEDDEIQHPAGTATVSIFEALAEILSKTTESMELLTTRTTPTTTTTTTTTTEIPDIIQKMVPYNYKDDDNPSITNTNNTTYIFDNNNNGKEMNSQILYDELTLSQNPLQSSQNPSNLTLNKENNTSHPQLKHEIPWTYNDDISTNFDIKNDKNLTTRTDYTIAKNVPQVIAFSNQNRSSKLFKNFNIHNNDSIMLNAQLNNNLSINLALEQTNFLELTTTLAPITITTLNDLPTTLPQSNHLTTPGSDLVTQPKLISAINDYLDASVQNFNASLNNSPSNSSLANSFNGESLVDTITESIEVLNGFDKLYKPSLLSHRNLANLNITTTASPFMTISFLDLFTIKPKKILVSPTQSIVEVHPVYVPPDDTTKAFLKNTYGTTESTIKSNSILNAFNETGRINYVKTFKYSKNDMEHNINQLGNVDREFSKNSSVIKPSKNEQISTQNSINISHNNTSVLSLNKNHTLFRENPYISTQMMKQNTENDIPTTTLNTDILVTTDLEYLNSTHNLITNSTTEVKNSFNLAPKQSVPESTPISNQNYSQTEFIKTEAYNNAESISSNMKEPLDIESTTTYRPRFQNRPVVLYPGLHKSTIATTNKSIQLKSSTIKPVKTDVPNQISSVMDYTIYGILPNNTVVRKRPTPASRLLNERLPIYGILPNNTVVRKYPNGSIIQVKYPDDEFEIVDIDPKMLLNPNSEIWRTTMRNKFNHNHKTFSHSKNFNFNVTSSTSRWGIEHTSIGNGLQNEIKDFDFIESNVKHSKNNFLDNNFLNPSNLISKGLEGSTISSTSTTNVNNYSSNSSSFNNNSNTENPVLLDLLKRKYIKADVSLKSPSVFSLTTSRNLIEDKTIMPIVITEPLTKRPKMSSTTTEKLLRNTPRSEDVSSPNDSNEIHEFELEDPLTLSEEEEVEEDKIKDIQFNPALITGIMQQKIITTIRPTTLKPATTTTTARTTTKASPERVIIDVRQSQENNFVHYTENDEEENIERTKGIDTDSENESATPSTEVPITTTSTTTKRIKSTITPLTTTRRTTTSTSTSSTTELITTTDTPITTTTLRRKTSPSKPKQTQTYEQTQTTVLPILNENLERNIRLLQELLGLQANLARRAQKATKPTTTTPMPTTTMPTTTSTTTTTTTPKPTTSSTTTTTTSPRSSTTTTTTSSPPIKIMATSKSPLRSTVATSSDDIQFLINLRQALFGQQTTKKPIHLATRPTATTTTSTRPTTTSTSSKPTTTTTTITTTTTLKDIQPKSNIGLSSIEELLSSFQTTTPTVKPITTTANSDDIAFLNSLRQIAKLNPVTTASPPTFANRIIELALQGRLPSTTPFTTTTTTTTTLRPTTTPRSINLIKEIQREQQDLKSLNKDLALLSSLLGRQITITDIPNLRNEIITDRSRKTSTTFKPQTTTPMTKDQAAEIERNLKLLSSLLGRQVTINELPLIMSELRGGRKAKATSSTSTTTTIGTTTPGTTTTTQKPLLSKPTLPEKKQSVNRDEILNLLKTDLGTREDIEVYGKTNEALLAAVLKQRGIGPVHNNIPVSVNDLFLVEPNPTAYTITRAPIRQRPQVQRRPLLEGLSWIWKAWQETAPTPKGARGKKQTSAPSINVELGDHSSGEGVDPTDLEGGEDFTELPGPSFDGGNLLTAAIGVTRAVTSFLGAALTGAAKSVQGAWQGGGQDYYSLSGGR